jgi:hypothetical protein
LRGRKLQQSQRLSGIPVHPRSVEVRFGHRDLRAAVAVVAGSPEPLPRSCGVVGCTAFFQQSSGLALRGLADRMRQRRGPNFALQVQGSSMIDEHIVDGDFVVVHGRQTAENGEMVIALVNGSEATVKTFYRETGGWIRLQPANAAMQPIRLQERDVLIQGVVVGVIRKY